MLSKRYSISGNRLTLDFLKFLIFILSIIYALHIGEAKRKSFE